MGHSFSSIIVMAGFLLMVVHAEVVTWYRPTDGETYRSGGVLVANWHSEYKMTDMSMRLCVENGMESDGVEDVGCGSPISPQIYQDCTTYEAFITLPNVTRSSVVYLQLQDGDGQLSASPDFTLSPNTHPLFARLNPLVRDFDPETRLNPLVDQDNSSATEPGPDPSDNNPAYVVPLASVIATAPLGCALIVFVYGRLRARRTRDRNTAPHAGLHEKGFGADVEDIKIEGDIAPQYLFLSPPTPVARQDSGLHSGQSMRRPTREPYHSFTPALRRAPQVNSLSAAPTLPSILLTSSSSQLPHSSSYSASQHHARFSDEKDLETGDRAHTFAHGTRSSKIRGVVPAELFKAPPPNDALSRLQNAPSPDTNAVQIPPVPLPAVQAPSSPVMYPIFDEMTLVNPSSHSSKSSSSSQWSQPKQSRPQKSRRSTTSSRNKRTRTGSAQPTESQARAGAPRPPQALPERSAPPANPHSASRISTNISPPRSSRFGSSSQSSGSTSSTYVDTQSSHFNSGSGSSFGSGSGSGVGGPHRPSRIRQSLRPSYIVPSPDPASERQSSSSFAPHPTTASVSTSGSALGPRPSGIPRPSSPERVQDLGLGIARRGAISFNGSGNGNGNGSASIRAAANQRGPSGPRVPWDVLSIDPTT